MPHHKPVFFGQRTVDLFEKLKIGHCFMIFMFRLVPQYFANDSPSLVSMKIHECEALMRSHPANNVQAGI